MIPLTPIDGSSLMDAAAHDPVTNTLAIRFKKGVVVHYNDVPAEVAAGLLSASSKGKYFAEAIRGRFEYVKQAAEEENE